MMKPIRLTILVEPTPKGRPKAARVGNRAIMYTPAKTRRAESDIQAAIREKLDNVSSIDRSVPLVLTAIFYVTKPKSARKKDQHPTKRPDLDNYEKLFLDALNQYAYQDDSQIVEKHTRKKFGSPPRIELEIRELENAL